jgi:hypothetical protein
MKVGDLEFVSGCFTQEKFIAGRTLLQIEKLLGFHEGRLAKGGVVLALVQLPQMQQFDVAGYSNVALHRWSLPSGLDRDVLKANARRQWAVTGPDRLVKVRPTIGHDSSLRPDFQYPHANGVPQWIVKVPLSAKVTGILSDYPEGLYKIADLRTC